jgi:Gly-Xaa carboxypeptidase
MLNYGLQEHSSLPTLSLQQRNQPLLGALIFASCYKTSQAAGIFNGGSKTNNLPEHISALVNYRIAMHQTPDFVKSRVTRIIAPIRRKHNLTLSAFENNSTYVGKNYLHLSTENSDLHPAPISPTDTGKDAVWTRFAGVIRSVFESVPSLEGKTVVVSGDIMPGNTDTRFYWNLSKNIYRFEPVRAGRAMNIHATDERIAIDAHLETMMLYYGMSFVTFM